VLLVDKPAGVTSHDVVARARRVTKTRRIGHAGTLDPFATGLLVLLVGRATRLLPFVDGEPKVYDAEIAFGSETDTDDATGAVTRTATVPAEAEILAATTRLTGAIDQMPPAYSAKQVGGVRAYAAARRGEALELRAVTVHVHEWQDVRVEGDVVRARIVCGAGTYIRALARDLGRLTGSAAHLRSLRRIRSGAFDVADATPWEALADGASPLLPPVAAVPQLSRCALDDAAVGRVVRGMRVAAPDGATGSHVALVDGSDALIAIARREGADLAPQVVLAVG
jgi:tRNA pseudouridine55 synthase